MNVWGPDYEMFFALDTMFLALNTMFPVLTEKKFCRRKEKLHLHEA